MTSERVVRRLSAILAADVVGYSRLMGQDEADTLARLKALRDHVIDPAIGEHRGRIVKTTGDGLLVEFASVVDGVDCAVEIQRALAEHNAEIVDDRRIVLRIGVNLGDVIVEDDDIFGDGVNVAARLEATAEPGGVLISETVHDSIAGKLDATFVDNGERAFKNIAKTIRVWSWPDGLSDTSHQAAAGRDRKPHVVVSDFEARGADEKDLADGIRDELAASFARQTGLVVTTDRGAADYEIRGGVRVAGGRCRVSAQLIGIDGDRQIWAERYDEEYLDSFQVQDQCIHRIAMSVRRRIAADDAGRLAGRSTDQMSVEELMALSGGTFFTPTKASWLKAGALAEQVLGRGSTNFMAMAMAAAGCGMAEIYFGFREPDGRTVATAFARIEEAQRLTDQSDMILVVYSGLLLYARRRYADAKAAAERSLQLNSDFNMGYWSLGAAEVFAGNYDTGVEAATRAMNIDIRDPYVHFYSRIAGYGHFGAARYREAAEWFWKADQAAPGLPHNLVGLAASHWLDDDHESARNAVARLLDAEPEVRVRELMAPPFKDLTVRDRMVHAWRAAGAPD